MKSTPPSERDFSAVRFDAAVAIDGAGLAVAPASLLLRLADANPLQEPGPLTGRAEILALGTPDAVDAHPLAPHARVLRRPGSLLIPGLVNAHTHLDLTHIGPRPFDTAAGFQGFVDTVRTNRRTNELDIAQSVRDGLALSLAGGVVAVGDIAGAALGRPTLAPFHTLREGLGLGVSFVEFFSIGRGEAPARERISQLLHTNRQAFGTPVEGVRPGIQPHAPTTVSRATFRWLLDQIAPHVPLCTHLAETAEERTFIREGRGPQREFLESLGLWDDSMLAELGQGLSPVAHLAPVLEARPMLCAHVNDAGDGDLAILSRTRASVAYCPRASAYFGAHERFGPHRYRDMLAAGINVCLGTDSVINLPSPCARLSTWDEARLLRQRDGTDAVILLRMATTHGARALGLDPALFTFSPGPLAGLAAVPLPGRVSSAPRALEEALGPGVPGDLELLYRWK
jgi:cytosine/adenosine deaminase-related metal-dependent hydrolase